MTLDTLTRQETTNPDIPFVEEERKIFTFEDILERESFILCDKGVTQEQEGGQWYTDGVFGAESFSELDEQALTNAKIVLEQSKKEFSYTDKVYTVPKVVEEFLQFTEIIQDKMSFLRWLENKKSHWDREADHEEKKKELKEIFTLQENIYQMAARQRFNQTGQPLFKTLENMIITLTQNIPGVKRNYDHLYNKTRNNYKNKGNKKKVEHTDEQLVAAAAYRSIIEREESSIVSSDQDIAKIVKTFQYFLKNNKSVPQRSNPLTDSFKENPIRVYLKTDIKTAELVYDTSWNGPVFEAIESLGEEDHKRINKLVKRYVIDLWKEVKAKQYA